MKHSQYSFIPEFDVNKVIFEPWIDWPLDAMWLSLMGFFIASACGLVGVFLMLRRMVLIGDAISHSLLPGIAIAFILSHSAGVGWLIPGAIIAGILTVLLIEMIHKYSRIKADAAIGIVFSTFFAVGVIIITTFADHVHLDADCVLYGQLELMPNMTKLVINETNLGPQVLWQMGLTALAVIVLLLVFYKELVVTTFDSGLAAALGIHPAYYHYGLAAVLSVVIVCAFESVGVILVIGMLIFPGACAMLLFQRLPLILITAVVFSVWFSLGGLHLSVWLNCSIGAAMTAMAFLTFIAVWIVAPSQGLIATWKRRKGLAKLDIDPEFVK